MIFRLPPACIWIDSLPEGGFLSPAEEAARDAFPSDKRRGDWALGRAAGKLAVAGLLAAEGAPTPAPTDLEIASAPSGAPRLVQEPGGPVALGLTHGHGRAGALALRPGPGGGLPGVDLERIRARRDGSLRFFLSEAEQARVLAQPRPDPQVAGPRDRLAILHWTLKEAAFKALQLPRGLGLLEVELELPPTWEATEGRASVRYRRAAAERYAALGGQEVCAGWTSPAPDLIAAWVVVRGASLPPAG